MKKYLLYVLLLTTVFTAVSCRRGIMERARRNIRLEEVESVRRQGLTGAVVVVRVANDSRHRLRLDQAVFELYYGEAHVGTILLREPVAVERRTTASVTTLWRMKVSDPLALWSVIRKAGSGDVSQIGVSCSLEGRGGPVPVKISRGRMPLSDFLNTFGLTMQDLEKQRK